MRRNWLLLGIALAAVLAMSVLEARPWSWVNGAAALRGLGVLAGDVGLALLAFTLVLGLRWSWLERVLGGLDELHRVHHVLGVSAFVLILAHPLLLAGSALTYSVEAAVALLVSPAGGIPLLLGWLGIALLVLVVLPSFLRAVPHRLWHGLHLLGWPAFLIGLLHGIYFRGGPGVLDGMLAALVAGAVVVRLALLRTRSRLDYVVERVRPLRSDTVELELAPLGPRLRFQPGQFVYVRFYDPRVRWQCTEYHPFTLCSGTTEPRLRLAIKALGDCTRKLVHLTPGARAHVRGPFGRLLAHPCGTSRQVWLAGGMGVTPFLGAVHSLASAGPQIDIYYCANRDEDACYLGELTEHARRTGRVRVLPQIACRQGFLSADRIARTSGDLRAAEFYVAGPPAFIQVMRRDLLAHGVARGRIHDERFA